MKPRPLYRWKSFWLGVCVLVFLGWAWVRSRVLWETLRWMPAFTAKYFLLFQGEGQLGVGSELRRGAPEGFEIFKVAIAQPPPWFPPWYEHGSIVGEDDHMVAHWFVMLMFFIAWGLFLAWRWRRMRRSGGDPG